MTTMDCTAGGLPAAMEDPPTVRFPSLQGVLDDWLPTGRHAVSVATSSVDRAPVMVRAHGGRLRAGGPVHVRHHAPVSRRPRPMSLDGAGHVLARAGFVIERHEVRVHLVASLDLTDRRITVALLWDMHAVFSVPFDGGMPWTWYGRRVAGEPVPFTVAAAVRRGLAEVHLRRAGGAR